jgi:signal transduction histidine kinase
MTCILFIVIINLVYLYFLRKQNLENKVLKNASATQNIEYRYLLNKLKEDERNRIAQEIHDDLGSTLVSISMAIEILKSDPQNKIAHSTINNAIEKLNTKTNKIIWSLNIQNDNLKSLLAYIRTFAKPFLEEAKIDLNWIEANLVEHLAVDGHVRRVIYLSVKELLTNIVKHAHANIVTIRISCHANHLTIFISDDGTGMLNDSSSMSKPRMGNGIRNLKQSMEKIGGQIIWNNINRGTQVNITIPFENAKNYNYSHS